MAIPGACQEEGVSGISQGHQEADGLPDYGRETRGGKVSKQEGVWLHGM